MGSADPASCFTPLVPGPVQVEELGCLEVEAEAKVEPAEAAVAAQPPAPVSRARARVLRVGAGRPALLTPKAQLCTRVPSSWVGDTALPLGAPPLLGGRGGSPQPGGCPVVSRLPALRVRAPTPWPLLEAGAGAGPDLRVWPHRWVPAAPEAASQPITMATGLTTMWTSPAAGSSSCLTRCVSWLRRRPPGPRCARAHSGLRGGSPLCGDGGGSCRAGHGGFCGLKAVAGRGAGSVCACP